MVVASVATVVAVYDDFVLYVVGSFVIIAVTVVIACCSLKISVAVKVFFL